MTPPTSTSPAYYAERLSLLLGTLSVELHQCPPGTWTARRIRSGYTVALALDNDGRRRCRVSCEDRPGSAAAWSRFHSEVEHMAQHLGVSSWRTVAPSLGPNESLRGAIVEFAEPGLAA